jgi:hypothetical protein
MGNEEHKEMLEIFVDISPINTIYPIYFHLYFVYKAIYDSLSGAHPENSKTIGGPHFDLEISIFVTFF